jgi:RND family efflux transporter MFP subunit
MSARPVIAIALGSVLGMGLAALALVGPAGAADSPPAEPQRPALTVTLARPRLDAWSQVVEASGGLHAWQEAAIAAETGGLRVVELMAEVGDRVVRGQALARLADETVRAELAGQEARVAQARASLAEARANADRARSVKDRGAMSDQQSTQYLIAEEAAQANLDAALAALESQRIRLRQTHIVAVDDGLVASRTATLGTVVQPGTELFRLVRQGRTEWRAEVTASQLAQIAPGQSAELSLPGGERVTGQVRIAAPTLDPATRFGLVYVDLPAEGPARPGMFARGQIRVREEQALTLPESAVVLYDGLSWVYLVGEGERVERRRVEIGRRSGGRVEIRGGLDPDSQVVASGGAFLNDGDLVRVEDPGAGGAEPKGLTASQGR